MRLLENVQALTDARHLTIAEVERGAGLKKSTITKWGTTSPGYDKVVAVADFFGVTMDELVGRSAPQLSDQEAALLDLFRQLNEDGQAAALAMLQGLTLQPGYIKSAQSGEMEA